MYVYPANTYRKFNAAITVSFYQRNLFKLNFVKKLQNWYLVIVIASSITNNPCSRCFRSPLTSGGKFNVKRRELGIWIKLNRTPPL